MILFHAIIRKKKIVFHDDTGTVIIWMSSHRLGLLIHMYTWMLDIVFVVCVCPCLCVLHFGFWHLICTCLCGIFSNRLLLFDDTHTHTHTHTHVCVCVCLDGSSLCYSFQFCPICRCLDGLPKKLKCIWLLIILVLQRQENSVYSSSNKISRKEIRDKPSIGAKKQRKKNRLKLN